MGPEEELSRAIAQGNAPQFELVRCVVQHRFGKTGRFVLVSLSVIVDGKRRTLTKKKEMGTKTGDEKSNGRLGSVDLLEQTIRELACRCWPGISECIAATNTVGYAVHAVGDESDHDVQVVLHVEKGERAYSFSRTGVDTIEVTAGLLHTIYHWVVWRWIRREQGLLKVARRSAP